MGYCYQGNKLCCDTCGAAGARKQKCPQNWCQPIACCGSPECKARVAAYRKTTCATSCKKYHAEMVARDAEEKARLDAGEWIRCAALSEQKPYHCVKVWFKNAAKGELIRYMTHEAYDAFPLCTPVNPEQYATVGRVEPAPF